MHRSPLTWILFLAILAPLLLADALFAQRNLKDIPDPDPELERKTFILPEGLEVNLWAGDPQIHKPIQMNFDAQGRLWVASSEVYPQIKPGQAATDKILVLEDTNFDGAADKTHVFADGLLIPTGVIPDDRGGCYVAASTELLHFQDTNGDLKADTRRIVLAGFGTEDTHHLLHTLRWGPDGCLYMNQSIYIHSHIETPYGVKRLNGGGIWRFRPETLELEVLCSGFVNPWGHHIDRWGQSFATDGAFGEGINYVFPGAVFCTAPGAKRIVAGLNPGSPKHCGLEIVSGRHLPPEWDGSMITSDFRAHRVCRFTVTEDGSGYASRQEVEVIKSAHPAFRPIDAKMGPDGALYIADWYNPIIQHGEVDFRDERRDHTHGRIWRVTAKGRPTLDTRIKADASIDELVALLKSHEEWVRQHAKNMLKGRDEGEVIAAVEKIRPSRESTDERSQQLKLECLWTHETMNEVSTSYLAELSQSPDHRVRAAAVRTASHWANTLYDPQTYFRRGIVDDHPRVRLEAVRAWSQVPKFERSPTLFIDAPQQAALALDKPLDRWLDFALWQTMRDLAPVWLPEVKAGKFDFRGNVNHLIFALKAAESPDAVQPLVALIEQDKIPADRVQSVLELIATLGGPREMGTIFGMIVAPDTKLTDARKAALLAALVETSKLRKANPAGDLSRLTVLFASADENVRAAAIRAAGAWKLEQTRNELTKLASDAGTGTPLAKHAAIEALASLGGPESAKTLAGLAASSAPLADRLAALAALSSLDVPQAAELTVKLLAEAPADFDPAIAIAALVARKQGSEALAKALSTRKLHPDTAKLVLRVVRSAPQPSAELVAAVQSAGGLSEAVWKLTPELVLELMKEVQAKGDPARGEAIFRTAGLQCLKCHAIGGAGGQVGPDMSSLGAAAQVDYLVESLIAPAAKVKENFHSKVVLDGDGRVTSGIPVRENGQEIVLRDAEDKLVTIARNNIENIKDGRSLMPDGTVDSLTRVELVDLVAFLSQLGKVGGNYTIGPARIVRRWQVLTNTPEAHRKLNRTSFDTAASDDGDLVWASAYSRVAGDLPLADLPTLKPHANLDPTTFVRFEVEVTQPGPVQLLVGPATGLALWLDGKPTPLADATTLDLATGKHRFTLAINRQLRSDSLRVELADVQDSPARVQVVGGK
ncbi:MAG: HEAT repeat domain-containing protein [Pirellulaceae bacterium]|nr:HEAT repeat domain-containing protein [Pirellulaceae bacterium]